MAITTEQVEGGSHVRFEGPLDISVAEELKTALLDALKPGGEVRLDLSGVTYLDVTAVQLLWAAQCEAAAKGTRLVLDSPVPEAIQSELKEAGFQELLAHLQACVHPNPSSGSDARHG